MVLLNIQFYLLCRLLIPLTIRVYERFTDIGRLMKKLIKHGRWGSMTFMISHTHTSFGICVSLEGMLCLWYFLGPSF